MSQSYLKILDTKSRKKEADTRSAVSCRTASAAFNAKHQEEKVHKEMMRFMTRKVEKLQSERNELLNSAISKDEVLHPRTRKSFEKMLGVMAVRGYGYDPSAKKSKVPTDIAKDLSDFGLELSPETIRNHIKDACRKHRITAIANTD